MLFTLAAEAQQRINTFRSDRIATIVAGQGPALIHANGRLFVHLIPLSAFGQAAQIDLERAYEAQMQFRPIASTSMTPRFNLDGFINVRGGGECYGYTQVFRNGIVEATLSDILREWSHNPVWPAQDGSRHRVNICHAGNITDGIATVLPGYFDGLRSLDVPAPIVIMLSYQGIADAKLELHGYQYDLDEIESFPPVEPLLLPEVVVDDYGSPQDYVRALRPIFDALWNAAGFSKCTYYNEDGDWKPPH